jgi:hypothetical protein
MSDKASEFSRRLNGRFTGILRWEDLDRLWETLNGSGKAWYFYQVGSEVPALPLKGDGLRHALSELDQLLHADHDHDYCGIVYVDDRESPTLVKVYDPNNLGSSCGSSGMIIPPRWIISLERPTEVIDDAPTPRNRQRWWQRLFS